MSKKPEKPYVAMARIGICKVCNREDDLRMGVCWDCCDFVDGEQLSPTTHRLWDRRNPSNTWIVSTTGDA
jgi:hypothetical protein